jgi:hypothetical protein
MTLAGGNGHGCEKPGSSLRPHDEDSVIAGEERGIFHPVIDLADANVRVTCGREEVGCRDTPRIPATQHAHWERDYIPASLSMLRHAVFTFYFYE